MEVNFISKYFDKVEMPNKKSSDKDNLVNEDIPFEQVLVISDAGEQLGVLSRMDALRIAEDRGYDLVCVAPAAKIPVCKLMDYSKYRYEQTKRAKEAKKNQKVINVKEVRISPTIDTNDFTWKMKNAREFLLAGDKVKVSCRFRGRMIDQAEITKQSFIKFAEGLSDVALMDSEPKLDGRNMFMNLSPIPEKKKK
jgi:translation initiation factor IF-3